jgi:hypothetical protein
MNSLIREIHIYLLGPNYEKLILRKNTIVKYNFFAPF